MRATVYIATSLDGFIARKDGSTDWLSSDGRAGPGKDHGCRALFDSVDARVPGRDTYDLVRIFGEWSYGAKPVFVLAHRPIEIPKSIAGTIEIVAATRSNRPGPGLSRRAARSSAPCTIRSAGAALAARRDPLSCFARIGRFPDTSHPVQWSLSE